MSGCCSLVEVKSEKLMAQAQACLKEVVSAQERRQQEKHDRAALALVHKKNRWYYFGSNRLYVPTQEEIERELDSNYPWYHLSGGFPKYPSMGGDLNLRVIKEVAERLLAAARMGEMVLVSTEDIHTISYLQGTSR